MGARKPAWAGQFYPRKPSELQETVEQHINQSGVQAAPESVVAIVVPHAGYVFSGPTAGYGYARVRNKKPKRVILMGCSHNFGIGTASVFDAGGFDCPLGTFPIDETFAKRLAQEFRSVSTQPHGMEHSLEVQLPFLWVALGATPIVPVLFGGPAREWHADMGAKLAAMVDDSDLVIASTDLSHFLSDVAAHRIDKHTLDTVLAQDCSTLIEGCAQDACSMCGESAVVVAMAFALARGAKAWSLLDYRTSARTSGDYGRVVGYAAISMERGS
jgi:hypothetical protein